MKRITAIVLIFVLVCAAFGVMSVSAFASESPDANESVTDSSDFSISGNLAELKTKLFGAVEKMISFINSNETYKKISTILLAVLAFIFIPIVIAFVFIVYVTIGTMIIFAGALTGVVEIIITILAGFVPL